ncbi:MAG: formylglycine-generating enzyme family protein [Acidobacteria bacterium]|nr:formylglycine-generating enzyme family protein [Acidobacteriota bacterium]
MKKRLFALLFFLLGVPVSVAFSQLNTPPTANRFTNNLGMEFVSIPSGEFMMGSDDSDIDLACAATKNIKGCKSFWTDGERPKHKVNIGSGILMMRFEVTQAQWKEVMGSSIDQQRDKWGRYSRSLFFIKIEGKYKLNGVGPDIPMYWVSWSEVNEFVRRMNDRNDGLNYTLPSEAEWEYACRAGSSETLYSFGNIITRKDANTVWNDGRYLDTIVKVGSYRPNAFGLFDMVGNVGEWTADMYFDNYEGHPSDGSPNLSKRGKMFGENVRVIRGGGYSSSPFNARCARRVWNFENKGFADTGFRLVARRKS